ncbi:restriction endonuclease [Mycolicibacterium sp. HK-90]|uniref:restriction endonuclease n=1 Tax=Mycolicibacterium sp. HK-90 TaxID=3056937 RepID=UPI0026596E1B|nr:restriction endonuclease [Mycolicibacterium sp. HK-90]WKG04644.1 restriction endonuclease [Mycolicibacterium sp. HK-90]
MIEDGVVAVHAEVAAELLKRLREQDRSFLAQSVLDALVAMGYGGTEQRATVLGGSGDGGIDGVIDQDPLGLERVYVQAKRYGEENSVQRADIQGSVGALHGMGANRGIFITTSRFSAGARMRKGYWLESGAYRRTEAQRTDDQVRRRCSERQVFTVVEVDEDYFE